MFNKDIRRDLLLLFCSFLFYFGFLVLNASNNVLGSKENVSFNNYDEPPERCVPRYENRIYRDDGGHITLKCVKISIPEIKIYERSCEELNLTNKEEQKECIIDQES